MLESNHAIVEAGGRLRPRDVRCDRVVRRRGMTLIEVLVASVLLGVGVSGLMLTAALGMRNQQRTEQRGAALYLANEKLAEIETIGSRMWSLTNPTSGAETRGGVEYIWSTEISPLTEGELSEVRVEVSWQGRGTAGGAVELETLLNDYGSQVTAKPADEQEGSAMDVKAQGRERR